MMRREKESVGLSALKQLLRLSRTETLIMIKKMLTFFALAFVLYGDDSGWQISTYSPDVCHLTE